MDHLLQANYATVAHRRVSAAAELPTVVICIVSNTQDRLGAVKNLAHCERRAVAGLVERPAIGRLRSHGAIVTPSGERQPREAAASDSGTQTERNGCLPLVARSGSALMCSSSRRA